MTETVELLPAFLWVCDECGRDNFVRARLIDRESLEGQQILDDMTAECAEMTDELGLTVDGHFLGTPSTVECQHCRARYATEVDGEIQ